MTPRPVGCDGPDCRPALAGWTHDPDCATQRPLTVAHLSHDTGPDWRDATDMEDGCYGRRVPQQRTTGVAGRAA